MTHKNSNKKNKVIETVVMSAVVGGAIGAIIGKGMYSKKTDGEKNRVIEVNENKIVKKESLTLKLLKHFLKKKKKK